MVILSVLLHARCDLAADFLAFLAIEEEAEFAELVFIDVVRRSDTPEFEKSRQIVVVISHGLETQALFNLDIFQELSFRLVYIHRTIIPSVAQ